MRREFSRQVCRDAFVRAAGQCEGCGARLTIGKFHYDHAVPIALGGDATLDNCRVLCVACHRDKTGRRDAPAIAKAKRLSDRHIGIRPRSQFPCAGSGPYKKKISGEIIKR